MRESVKDTYHRNGDALAALIESGLFSQEQIDHIGIGLDIAETVADNDGADGKTIAGNLIDQPDTTTTRVQQALTGNRPADLGDEGTTELHVTVAADNAHEAPFTITSRLREVIENLESGKLTPQGYRPGTPFTYSETGCNGFSSINAFWQNNATL